MPFSDQPQPMGLGRHRRIPSSAAAEEVSTFGVVNESTKPCEQDPSGRYVRYPMLLGRGACKRVFRAFDCEEGKEVAWNQVELAGVQITEDTRERLFAEIHVLQRLHHKNIMSFMSYFYNSKLQTLNFITEIFMSGTLRQYRKKVCVMNENILKRWAWQILEGLVYLHGHEPPIVHRDLKCDNIFVNGNTGQIKIGDLGYATAQQGLSVVGTPEFMAPEIYEEKYDHKVDIYSFGMCLLELATLEFPYSECHGVAHIFRKVTQGIKPQALQRVQSEQLRQIIELCIAHDPEERPEARRLLKHPYFAQLREQGSGMTGSGSQYSSTPNLSALPHPQSAGSNGLPVSQLHRRPELHGPSNLSSQPAAGRREAEVPASSGSPPQPAVEAGAGTAADIPAAAPAASAAAAGGQVEGGAASSPLSCASREDGNGGAESTQAPLLREATLREQVPDTPGPAHASVDGPILADAAARVTVASQLASMVVSSGVARVRHYSQLGASSSPAPAKQRMESMSRLLDRRERLHQSVDLSQLAHQLHKHDSVGPRSGQGVDEEDAMSESSDEVVIIPLQCLASMDNDPARTDGDAGAEPPLDGEDVPDTALPQRDSRTSVVLLSSATSLLMRLPSTHTSPTTTRVTSAGHRSHAGAARDASPTLSACRSAPALRRTTPSCGGEQELLPLPLPPCSSAGPVLTLQAACEDDTTSPPRHVHHPSTAGTSTAASPARPGVSVDFSRFSAPPLPMLATPLHQPPRPLTQWYTDPVFTACAERGHDVDAEARSPPAGHEREQPAATTSPATLRRHATSAQVTADEEPQAEGSGTATRPIHGIIVRLKQCRGQGFGPTIQKDRLSRASTL